MREKNPEISWVKVREDFNFDSDTFRSETYYANYFMRKGLHNLMDLKGIRILDCYSKRIGINKISLEGIAVLCVLCNWYDIPINISNEGLIFLEKDMDKAKKALRIGKNEAK